MMWANYFWVGIGLIVVGVLGQWAYAYRWGYMLMVLLVAIASATLVLWSCLAIAAACCGQNS